MSWFNYNDIIGSRVLPVDITGETGYDTYYIAQVKYSNGVWYGISKEKDDEFGIWEDINNQKKYCAFYDEQKAYRALEDYLAEAGE